MRASFRRGAGIAVGAYLLASCAAAPPRESSGVPLSELDAGDAALSAALDASSQLGATERGTPDAHDEAQTGQDTPDATETGWPAIVEVSGATPYPPGGRVRAPGAVNASSDDENIARWNRGGWAGATSEVGGDNKPPHPAPRVKVDVLKITGKASEADVLRVARSKGYWPLRLCYEEGLRRDQKLHGSVKFRITIGNGGDVRQVAARPGSDLDDKKVVGCVLRAAKGITFPRPLRGTAQASLEVSLWPGDEPVYASKAVTWGNELDAQALLSALRAHDGDVKTCFAAGLSRHAGLWGRLALRLRVTPAGTFTDPTEVESRFPDTDVTRCVASALEGAAAPRVSRDVLIVYPLRFGRDPLVRETEP